MIEYMLLLTGITDGKAEIALTKPVVKEKGLWDGTMLIGYTPNDPKNDDDIIEPIAVDDGFTITNPNNYTYGMFEKKNKS